MSDIPAPGTVVGDKYLVSEPLAQGGMGCVVRARHQLLEHEVAIKFVLDRSSPAAQTRLLREARAMRALTSEHVVEVFDLGMHGDAPYIVMELLEGRDLRDVVEEEGPMPVPDAVDAILEASVAVAEAHAMGIVHRDLKPANLFRATTRQRELVKVLDFGISKVPESDADDIHATTEDTLLGTPHFSSPEQLRNPARIDERADIWALGVTLYFLLTGELPFEGSTRHDVMGAIFADPPTPLSAVLPDVAPELEETIAATLVKRPEQRMASIAELVAALRPFAAKRGETAADRVLEPTAPRPRSASPAPRTASPQATTAGGLSSTLVSKDTEEVTQGAPADPASHSADGPASPPWRVAALVAVVAVAGWLASRPSAPGGVAASFGADVVIPTLSATADAPVPTSSATAEATAEASVSPTASAAPPHARVPPAKVPSPPRPKPSPAPTTSASAPPAVDIDGLPIIR